jgi:hypothetical protein
LLFAFRTGFVDGLEQPYELTSGMTWHDPLMNEVYDHGVNCGQRVGAFVTALHEARKAFLNSVHPQNDIDSANLAPAK